jgi:hypothetical protein
MTTLRGGPHLMLPDDLAARIASAAVARGIDDQLTLEQGSIESRNRP